MVQVVVLDFDGVIRHWKNDKTKKVEHDCKVEAGTLSSICFEADLLQPAITGKITWNEWLDKAHARLRKAYGLGVADHYIEAWIRNGFTIDHDLIRQLRELFPEAKLALATNATSNLPSELKRANLQSSFDFIFNSSAMGVAKPRREYFYGALMSMGVTAAEAVFIDDTVENVMAAKDIGLHAIHFDSRSHVLESLTQLALQTSMVAT